MPVCRQVEGWGGALHGSGLLGECSTNESPCHPDPVPACPAGAEERGNETAMSYKEGAENAELSPEWRNAITSTPRVEIEKVDLTVSPRGRVQAPTVKRVEVIDPIHVRSIVRRLRKRTLTIETIASELSASEESSETREPKRKNAGKRKKEEIKRNPEDKKLIEQLREEIKKLKKRIEGEARRRIPLTLLSSKGIKHYRQWKI